MRIAIDARVAATTIRRLSLTLGLTLVALLATGLSVAGAATPGWKVLALTGPTNLPPVSSEIQELSVDATGGTYTLGFEAAETAPIAFDATAAELRQAVEALATVGGVDGSVEVSGGPGDAGATTPYFVRFRGSLAGEDVAQLTADSGSLTGGAGTASVSTTTPGGEPGEGRLLAFATNVGGAQTVGTTTMEIGPLPPGIETAGSPASVNPSAPLGAWSCLPSGAGQTMVTCTLSQSVPALNTAQPILVPLRVGPSAAPKSTVAVTVEGGGAAQAESYEAEITVSEDRVSPGIQAAWAGAFDADGDAATQAGAHANAAGTMFLVNTNLNPEGIPIPAGDSRDVIVNLPPGFVGNPMVTDRCPKNRSSCGLPETAVGEAKPFAAANPPEVNTQFNGVWNDTPPTGYAAQFSFRLVDSRATILATLRSDEDFGVSLTAPNIIPFYKVYGSYVMLEGAPPAAEGKAFLTNPTGCATEAAIPPVTEFLSNSWQMPSLFDRKVVDIPPVVGCEQLRFEPEFAFRPGTSSAATGTGAEAELTVDQANLTDPDELAAPHLKRSVVTLPEGLNVNPAAAGGLAACTTDQIGYIGGGFPAPNPIRFDEEPVGCPDASKVGVAEVETPLLEDSLEGTVYLAAQGDNPFGSLIALYIVVEDERTGITLKLPGKVTPNPATGQLTAEFDNNPQAPFERLDLRFRGGGPRSTLATPDVCGEYETRGSWTPWSAPESGPPAQTADSFAISRGVGGGACPQTKAQRPFAPGLSAGVTHPVAGAHSPFVLRLTRPDGNQEIDRVDVTTPPGFAATLKGVATCPDAGIAQALARSKPGDGKAELASPSCPAASQLGTTTIGAGVGPEPIYVDTGKAYLTGPYKGAPVSLTFIVPAVAGPFDLGVQVVRTALRIDPRTAQITAESDPIPQILQGIPVQIRDIRVAIDRPGFSLNPTNCEAMSVAAKVSGGSGALASLSNRFQVGACSNLGFKPRIKLRLFGGVKRAQYQGLRAVVRPRPGDANIGRTVVRMPRSAFLAQEHIRTVCTRVQFAADACPKGAVYGRAIAYSPLLDYPLRGNVYLRSSDNKLPDLVADLRGPAHQPIRVELVGRTDSVKGALRNTFDTVPDAPVSYFRLQLFGGKKGLIVNSRNICRGKNRAAVRLDAQNGRGATLRPQLFSKRCAKLRKAGRDGHRDRK